MKKINYKHQRILYIYDRLIEYGEINKDDIINSLDISLSSFNRYIQEIRAFLYNYHMGELICKKNKYFIDKNLIVQDDDKIIIEENLINKKQKSKKGLNK